MSHFWFLFSLIGPPIAAVFAHWFFRASKGSPEAIILLNGLMPGTGLAAAHRPSLEIIAGVLFAQATLLITGSFKDIGFVVPSMCVGAVWALLYTPFNPLIDKKPATGTAAGLILKSCPPLSARTKQPAPTTDELDPTEGYAVSVRCTECGADVDVQVLEHMAHCQFCDSDHLVVGHDETLYVTIPEKVVDNTTLRNAILDHYRYIQYLKLYKRHVASIEAASAETTASGAILKRPETAAVVAAAEAAVAKRADVYRARLDGELKIASTVHFLAPYRHGMGTLFQAAFGRTKIDQNKALRFAIGTIEAAVAAFDDVPLPKMGKLSYLRVLSPAAKYGDQMKTLPLDANEASLDEAYGDIDRKQLIREIDIISMGAVFSPEVTAVVWRPWWIAEVRSSIINERLLIDSAAASVASIAPTLDPTILETLPMEARTPGIGLRFLPMECPTCGFEFSFEPSAVLHFCHNCHRLFRIDGSKKVELAYAYANPVEDPDFDLVPFWEFDLRLRTNGGRLITDLEHLRDGIDGTMDQLGDDAIAGQHKIYIPAIRCINSRLMAMAFNSLFTSVLNHPPQIIEKRFPLDVKPKPFTIALAERVARSLAPLYLANAFTRRDIARVNVHQVGDWLFNANLESRGRLTYLTAQRTVTEPFRRYIGRHYGGAVHTVTKGRMN